MRDIALAILSVGLCFYIAYNHKANNQRDPLAALIAFIAAVLVLIP